MTREEMIGKIRDQFLMGRRGNFGVLDLSADILDAIELAIRADERARVVAEATSDEAVIRANRAHVTGWQGDPTYDMRAAIRAALGTTEDKP